jgi:hypothetical protein
VPLHAMILLRRVGLNALQGHSPIVGSLRVPAFCSSLQSLSRNPSQKRICFCDSAAAYTEAPKTRQLGQ